MKNNFILFVFIILGLSLFSNNVFALEEINFPDATYIIDNGKLIEKSEYYKGLEEQKKKEEKENSIFKQYIPIGSKLNEDICLVEGYSTYYANKFHGRKTASGEVYNKNLMTAAMNGIKLGTKVKVTNLTNNKSIIVKVNDRIGSKKNVIDLSPAAFKKIANLSTGRVKVNIEILK